MRTKKSSITFLSDIRVQRPWISAKRLKEEPFSVGFRKEQHKVETCPEVLCCFARHLSRLALGWGLPAVPAAHSRALWDFLECQYCWWGERGCEGVFLRRLRLVLVFVSIRHLFWMSGRDEPLAPHPVPKATILQQVSTERKTRQKTYEEG